MPSYDDDLGEDDGEEEEEEDKRKKKKKGDDDEEEEEEQDDQTLLNMDRLKALAASAEAGSMRSLKILISAFKSAIRSAEESNADTG